MRRLLVVSLLLLSFCAVRLPQDWDETSKSFYKTTSFIMTGTEKKVFLGLQTRVERMAWINNFWARRFPDPNERKVMTKLYYDRVRNAVIYFSERYRPGYETDRGRIYILLGAPERVETFKDLPISDAWDADERGIMELLQQEHSKPYGAVVQDWIYYRYNIILRFLKRTPEDIFRLTPGSTYQVPYIYNLSPFTTKKRQYTYVTYAFKENTLKVAIPYTLLIFNKEGEEFTAKCKLVITIKGKMTAFRLKVGYIKGRTFQVVRFKVSDPPSRVLLIVGDTIYPATKRTEMYETSKRTK